MDLNTSKNETRKLLAPRYKEWLVYNSTFAVVFWISTIFIRESSESESLKEPVHADSFSLFSTFAVVFWISTIFIRESSESESLKEPVHADSFSLFLNGAGREVRKTSSIALRSSSNSPSFSETYSPHTFIRSSKASSSVMSASSSQTL